MEKVRCQSTFWVCAIQTVSSSIAYLVRKVQLMMQWFYEMFCPDLMG
ncbi:hypothetical protein LINPERPRIM_LOCUS38897 [Linum perenne]